MELRQVGVASRRLRVWPFVGEQKLGEGKGMWSSRTNNACPLSCAADRSGDDGGGGGNCGGEDVLTF